MNIIQSPDIYETRLNAPKRLFLAGGISDCPDWQKDLQERFWKLGGDIAIFNPRREGGLCKEGADAMTQIVWEHQHLNQSTHILFWFPEETLCPISLFELGKWAEFWRYHIGHLRHNMTIGVHPNYKRKFDIEVQIGLIDEYMTIQYSLDDLFDKVCDTLKLN